MPVTTSRITVEWGMRIPVQDVLGYLASGMSENEILEDLPALEKEDFQAIYKFAAQMTGSRPAG